MTFSLDQYNALGDGRGFVELPGWSSVTFTGGDRQTFLNNFCTNDVKRLTPGESCEAFVTSVKGKVLGHGLVTCRDRELVFVTVSDQALPLMLHLERYIIHEDVEVRDTTAERSYLLASGDALFSGPWNPAIWYPWRILRPDQGGLLECGPLALPRVRQDLVSEGAITCDMAAFHALRIEAGMPLFGVDFDAENLPQEVARNERAISFTKGCYLGQETVARIDALGHVNQELTGVRFDGTEVPSAGMELMHEGSVAGRVTSATFSPRLNAPLALAMIRRRSLPPGTRLDSPAGVGDVVKLPIDT